jgi:hypothetical protein
MTDISRRGLLGAGAFGLVLGPVVSGPLAAAGATTGTQDLYVRSRFTPLLGKAFTLNAKTGIWRVTLTEVADLAHPASGARHCFALTFRCSGAGPTQGSYSLRRSGFTSTTLFVVPSDAGRRTYQAVINSAP